MMKTWPASFVLALWLIGSAIPARAVSPLVTDDADTLPRGQLQINSVFIFTRTGPTDRYSVPMDLWFIGQAVRQTLNKNWTILTEAYALVPSTRAGGTRRFTSTAGHNWLLQKTSPPRS